MKEYWSNSAFNFVISIVKANMLCLIIILSGSVILAQKIVWKPLASLPQASPGGEAVAYNNKIYFISYSDTSNPNFYEYDILSNKWKALHDLPDNGNHSAVEIDGSIYVISGDISASSSTNFVYSPETNNWSPLTPMPTKRQHFDCSAVNHKIYVMGGITSFDDVPASCIRKNEVYDAATDSWTEKSALPTWRNNPAVVAIDSLIYLIGGAGTSSSIWNNIRTVECYNTNTDRWETKSSLPAATFKPGAVAMDKKNCIGWICCKRYNILHLYL